MIKLTYFGQSNLSYELKGSKCLAVVFGAGSSCATTDGWNGGIAATFYPTINVFNTTDVHIGSGGDPGAANAGNSRFLNTIATAGGIAARGSVLASSQGFISVIDNGQGAMGNWLSPKDYDRSNLKSDLENYITPLWSELTTSEAWNSLFAALSKQSLSQATPNALVEYTIDGSVQPGAYGINGITIGACGAVFLLTEYENA